MKRAMRLAVATGSILAAAGTAHAAVNCALLRRPPAPRGVVPRPENEHVSVLLPVRDEAHRVGPCLRSILDQVGVPGMEVVVLDDRSSDGTADLVAGIVAATAGDGPRVRIVHGVEPPDGWLGKPHACHQLAEHADPASAVLVFVDADVVLAPHAIASTLSMLESSGLDLVSPYPRQDCGSVGERLVQPLLQWSWLTMLPLRLAERSPRPSLTAANGQLLAVRRPAYRAAGGHAAVGSAVIEDVELLKAIKRTGGRGGVVDGTALATCRMYASWDEIVAGYTKSLGAAFGSPVGAAAVVGLLSVAYVLPAVAALAGSRIGLAGYLAGAAGRALTARRTGGRAWPDALAQPVSIGLFGWLTARSLIRRRRGTATWKGRPLRAEQPR